MTARGASKEAPLVVANAAIEDKMSKVSLGQSDSRAEGVSTTDSAGDDKEFTADEADALQKLLAADREGNGRGESTDQQNPNPNAGGKDGDGKAREQGQRQPRLERQVFVGGLPVDVTSTLFRTWADQVFQGRVINAVLVSPLIPPFSAVTNRVCFMILRRFPLEFHATTSYAIQLQVNVR